METNHDEKVFLSNVFKQTGRVEDSFTFLNQLLDQMNGRTLATHERSQIIEGYKQIIN